MKKDKEYLYRFLKIFQIIFAFELFQMWNHTSWCHISHNVM